MKKLLITLVVLLFVIAVLIFRPVPIVKEDQALVAIGVVTSIYEGGTNDIVFRLGDNPTRYYINRGLEAGLDIELLRSELLDKEVIIKYPDYWTPLDWNNRVKHLSKLQVKDSVLFNELRN